jgi:hypothetical protein
LIVVENEPNGHIESSTHYRTLNDVGRLLLTSEGIRCAKTQDTIVSIHQKLVV